MNHIDPAQHHAEPTETYDLAMRRLIVVAALVSIGVLCVALVAFYLGMVAANAVGMAIIANPM